MTRYARKKGQSAPNRRIGKRCLKTKRYKKDVDQIVEEIQKGITTPAQKRPFEMVEDLPASGEFFCVECDRFFVDDFTLKMHKKSKQHKQRARELKTPAYSHDEAARAAGKGSYIQPSNSMQIDDNSDIILKKEDEVIKQ